VKKGGKISFKRTHMGGTGGSIDRKGKSNGL